MPIQDLWKGEKSTKTRKRWRVYWDDPETGKRRYKSFSLRDGKDVNKHAAAFDAHMQAQINAGRYVDPDAGKITVETYTREWLATLAHLDPSTAERYLTDFERYVFPYLGGRALGSVQASHIRGWVKARSGKLSPNTVRNAYIPLKAMFVAAVDDGKRGATPCVKSIKLPEVEETEHYLPVVGQVTRLTKQVAARFELAILLAAFCGLRASEIMGLEERDFDLAAGKVRVRRALKKLKNRPVFLDHPKTKTSARDVDLPDIVLEALARHVEAGYVRTVELPDNTVKRKPDAPMVTRPARLMFTTVTGKPVTNGNWSYYWRKARAAVLGLPANFSLHDLRHWFGSLLVNAGWNVKRVQKVLGHAQPSITLNVYTHLWPDDDLSTRATIAAVVEGKEKAA